VTAAGSAARKVAVIAGAGSGIGAECARLFARSGYDLALIGRRPEPLQNVAAECAAHGAQAKVFPADVRDWDRLGQVREEVSACYGGAVDVLINSAGGQFLARAEDISSNGWRAVVDVNLNGTFFLCRQFLPLMRVRGASIVVLVANIWQRAAVRMAHSGAARAGVVSLVRTLAVEWADYGIRVNALSPGVTATPAVQERYGGLDHIAAQAPLKRYATPAEIAEAAAFLVNASYVTGEVLVVDGGLQLV